MRNRIPCQREAGTRLATALRRRPFSAYNKGNRRRLHAAKTDRKLCVFMQRSCDLLQKWSIFVWVSVEVAFFWRHLSTALLALVLRPSVWLADKRQGQSPSSTVKNWLIYFIFQEKLATAHYAREVVAHKRFWKVAFCVLSLPGCGFNYLSDTRLFS